MKKGDIIIVVLIIAVIAVWYWQKRKKDLQDRLPEVKPPSILQQNIKDPVIATPTQWQAETARPIPMPRNSTPVAAPVTDARALVNKMPPAYQAN